MSEAFSLGRSQLSPEILVLLAQKANPKVNVEPDRWALLRDQRQVLESSISQGKTIYGVNTGFGFLSQVRIPENQIEELQLNLIRSHACGVGEWMEAPLVRGLLLLKAHNFLQGNSGVTERCVQALLDFLRCDILPMIPSKGSVGASGDLAPLAHLALALIGEGRVLCQGDEMPTLDAMQKRGLRPLVPKMKEGLSLINGTHFMSVVGSAGFVEAKKLTYTADVALALSLSAMKGTERAFDPRIHALRAHSGQVESAEHIRSLLSGTENPAYSKVQDPYSLRCGPQVHGVARMTLDFVDSILRTELNAITDNPLVFGEDVLSGGNFHGEPLACSYDYLSIALTELGNISERRTEKLTNPSMSGLPAFLTKSGGLNSGYMIPHVVAASLASENKVLSHPSSVDSIPTSADKEDHVSMGAFGARKLRMITKNLAWILAIELLAACQAIDIAGDIVLSQALKRVYDQIRSLSPCMEGDRSLHRDIEEVSLLILKGGLLDGLS